MRSHRYFEPSIGCSTWPGAGVTSPNSRAQGYNENIAQRLTAAVELLPPVAICELARKLGGTCDRVSCSCEAVWTTEKLMSLIHAKQALNLVPQLSTLSKSDINDLLNHISHGRCNRDTLHQNSESTLRGWLKLNLLQVSSKPWCSLPEQVR